MAAVTGPGPVSPSGRAGVDGRTSPPGSVATPPLPEELVRSICPYLGTGDGWRLAVPDRVHRCLAVAPPIPLALEKQGRLCLGPAHVECATYRAARDPARRGGNAERAVGGPGPSVSSAGRRWAVPRTQATVLDVGRGSVDFAAVARQRATTQVALVVLALLAFGALILSRLSGDASAVAVASGVPTTTPAAAAPLASPPSPAASAVATPIASSELDETPGGSATAGGPPPSSAGASAGAAAPSPAPTFRSYTVRAGDTLAAIARRFGTTVSAIRAANGIVDPRTLRIGQVLRIP